MSSANSSAENGLVLRGRSHGVGLSSSYSQRPHQSGAQAVLYRFFELIITYVLLLTVYVDARQSDLELFVFLVCFRPLASGC